MASLPSLFRHKMLCPSGNKIMPDWTDCQGFALIFYVVILFFKSISYDFSLSKYFKNMRKKMTQFRNL